MRLIQNERSSYVNLGTRTFEIPRGKVWTFFREYSCKKKVPANFWPVGQKVLQPMHVM